MQAASEEMRRLLYVCMYVCVCVCVCVLGGAMQAASEEMRRLLYVCMYVCVCVCVCVCVGGGNTGGIRRDAAIVEQVDGHSEHPDQ